MKQAIVELLAPHHTETIIEDQPVETVFQKDMSFSGTIRCILIFLHFVNLTATHSFLILLWSQISELLQLVYSKFDVKTSNIELPTKKRTRFFYENCVSPQLSSSDVLMLFKGKTCQLRRFIGSLDLFRVYVCFGSEKFRISEESQILCILYHWGKLKVALLIHYFIAKHGCFFDLIIVPFREKRDVSEDQKKRIPDVVRRRRSHIGRIGSDILQSFRGMCLALFS